MREICIMQKIVIRFVSRVGSTRCLDSEFSGLLCIWSGVATPFCSAMCMYSFIVAEGIADVGWSESVLFASTNAQTSSGETTTIASSYSTCPLYSGETTTIASSYSTCPLYSCRLLLVSKDKVTEMNWTEWTEFNSLSTLVWLEGLQQEEVSTLQKWNEEWATTDVTSHSLVVDPSIAPPGFDLRRRLWSTLNHFRTGQGRCATTSSAGIRLQIHPVPVARLYRLCYILWTIVQIWNSPAVCQPCVWLRRRLSPGSACSAHATKKSTLGEMNWNELNWILPVRWLCTVRVMQLNWHFSSLQFSSVLSVNVNVNVNIEFI